MAEPDRFLEDLVKVVHNVTIASSDLRFLRHLIHGTHDIVTAADCVGVATQIRAPSASTCATLATAGGLASTSARFSYLRSESTCARPATVSYNTCPSLPPFPPSPPPPPAPAPPASAGTYVAVDEVVVALTASGSVSDYGESALAPIRQSFATAAAIPTSDVLLSVVAASVTITATLTAPNASASATILQTMETSLSSSTAASRFLGITVVSTPTVGAQRRYVRTDGDDDNTGVIIGL